MLAKVCPRCGAQYENLRSTTCPQCFAKLLIIDEATAEQLASARAQVEQTPEFQEAKAADDEKFREQSFGACAGVAGIFLVTAVVVIALLVHAWRHQPSRPAVSGASLPLRRQENASVRSADSLPVLPVAAASLDDVLPASVGTETGTNPVFSRTAAADAGITLPGTLTGVFHAVYRVQIVPPALPPPAAEFDVYAMPAGRPTSEENTFQLGIAFAAASGRQRKEAFFFNTQYWRYAAVGPGLGEAFSRALLHQMSR